MVKFYIQTIILLLIFSSCDVFPQSEQIDLRKQELSNLKNEISRLEKDLEQKNKKEKKSLAALDNVSKQNFLVSKLVANLRAEEKQKELEIQKQTENIASIEKEIDLLQKNYAKYVKATFKNGSYTDWESILNSGSVQQAIIRLEYLKRFSYSRKKDLVKLEKNKEDLIVAKKKLQDEKNEKHILSQQKMVEEKSLKKKLKEQKAILSAIKKDKRKIAKSVSEKRKSEQKIRDLIVELVEEAERKRKEEEERLKNLEINVSAETKTKKEVGQTDYNVDLSTSKFSSFSELKGKLNYPVARGKVVRKFGESVNRKLKTVTVNYGIDIKASGDLTVKCVAEGVVSTVEWLPGYGTVLIISHKGNYRTVYGHLAEVFVKEGDKINTGGVIGKINESVEGKILHFELWNARQYVDPELWLRK